MKRRGWLGNCICGALLLFNVFVCSFVAAAEQPAASILELNDMIAQVKPVPAGPQTAEDALSYADRLKSIAAAIKSRYQEITATGSSQAGFGTIIITKVKAIIIAIEAERKSLVDMVMLESTANTTDPEKLDSIITSLESQRLALSDLINPLAGQNVNSGSDEQDAGSNKKEINNPFKYTNTK